MPARNSTETLALYLFYSFQSADYQETCRLMDEDLCRDLGHKGLSMATSLRLHNFGTLVDENGKSFAAKKLSPVWLACEAACLVDSIERLAQSN